MKFTTFAMFREQFEWVRLWREPPNRKTNAIARGRTAGHCGPAYKLSSGRNRKRPPQKRKPEENPEKKNSSPSTRHIATRWRQRPGHAYHREAAPWNRKTRSGRQWHIESPLHECSGSPRNYVNRVGKFEINIFLGRLETSAYIDQERPERAASSVPADRTLFHRGIPRPTFLLNRVKRPGSIFVCSSVALAVRSGHVRSR